MKSTFYSLNLERRQWCTSSATVNTYPLINTKKKACVINTEVTVTSRKRQREEEREKEKWQTRTIKPMSSNTGELTLHEQLLKDWDDVMTDVKLPDGAYVEDLLDELVSLKHFGFDENEHETLKMMRDGKRLAAPSQLGDWITIDIDATKKLVTCKCEQYNSYGKCAWVAVLEVLQINMIPPSHCNTVNGGFGWNSHVVHAREAVKNHHGCVTDTSNEIDCIAQLRVWSYT